MEALARSVTTAGSTGRHHEGSGDMIDVIPKPGRKGIGPGEV